MGWFDFNTRDEIIEKSQLLGKKIEEYENKIKLCDEKLKIEIKELKIIEKLINYSKINPEVIGIEDVISLVKGEYSYFDREKFHSDSERLGFDKVDFAYRANISENIKGILEFLEKHKKQIQENDRLVLNLKYKNKGLEEELQRKDEYINKVEELFFNKKIELEIIKKRLKL